MGWVENKSIGFFLPAFTDELEGGESTESLESFGEIVSSDEVVEVNQQLVMTVVVIALDGRFLDGSVHAFYLPVGPGMIRFCQPMFDAVQQTDPVKGMSAKAGGWPLAVLWQIGELDSVIGEHGMDAVWDRFDKGLKKGGGSHVGFFH